MPVDNPYGGRANRTTHGRPADVNVVKGHPFVRAFRLAFVRGWGKGGRVEEQLFTFVRKTHLIDLELVLAPLHQPLGLVARCGLDQTNRGSRDPLRRSWLRFAELIQIRKWPGGFRVIVRARAADAIGECRVSSEQEETEETENSLASTPWGTHSHHSARRRLGASEWFPLTNSLCGGACLGQAKLVEGVSRLILPRANSPN